MGTASNLSLLLWVSQYIVKADPNRTFSFSYTLWLVIVTLSEDVTLLLVERLLTDSMLGRGEHLTDRYFFASKIVRLINIALTAACERLRLWLRRSFLADLVALLIWVEDQVTRRSLELLSFLYRQE